MKRIAIAGAGGMARIRARALLAAGEVGICIVASRRLATAQAFAAEIGCAICFDDYHQLITVQPDALLVEVSSFPLQRVNANWPRSKFPESTRSAFPS